MLVVATGKPITSVGSRANLVTGEYKKLSKCRGQKNCTHETRKGNDIFTVLFQDTLHSNNLDYSGTTDRNMMGVDWMQTLHLMCATTIIALVFFVTLWNKFPYFQLSFLRLTNKESAKTVYTYIRYMHFSANSKHKLDIILCVQ